MNTINQKVLKQFEDDILTTLKNCDQAKLLDDDEIINKLDNTKEEANRIKKDQIESEKREQQIKIERDNYLDLATRITLLFFILVDFTRINIMYQFSLLWYKHKFEQAIELSTPEEEQFKRIEDIWKFFLSSIYEDVCRALFECDRLLFSFCIATRLEIN